MLTGKSKLKKERLKLTLFAVPFIIFIIAFSYVPLFGWILAFIDYKPGLNIWSCDFAGLYYFKLIFQDWYKMSAVLKNTLAMSFLGLLCSPLPVIFAVFLSELRSIKLKRQYRLLQQYRTL